MKKILVVDDESDVVEVITGYLESCPNYEVFKAYNGKDAIEKLKAEQFDLVITDMVMPEVNGIELTEYIHNNLPNTKILACSGGGESGTIVAGLALDQALHEGADNGLLKPFDEEQLLSKVKALIGN